MLQHKSMPYRRLAVLTLALVMLIALISACGKKEAAGTVIATYKGGEITDKEFDKYIAFQTLSGNQQIAMYASIPQFKEMLIKQYIVSKKFNTEISAEDKKKVQTAVDAFKKDLETAKNTQPDFKKKMEDSDITVKEMVAFYQEVMSFQAFYAAKGEEMKPTVKEEEIKAEYEKAPSDYNVITVRHILVGTVDPTSGAQLKSDEEALKLAKEVKAKLDAGGDWNALAKEYSTDTGSKDKGGLYEKMTAKGWVEAFKKAANTQAIGVIGEPVQTEFGYHVMKVESRVETPYDKLSDKDKDGIKTTIASAKLNEFLTAEQDKLEIKVTLPAEPSPSASGTPGASPSPSASTSMSPSPSASATPTASASAK